MALQAILHSKIGKVAMYVCALALAAGWMWGIILYLTERNIAGAIGAAVLPPVGVLHGAHLF